jgi:hypothetical protein
MKNENTTMTTPARYRATVTVTVRNPKTGRTTTYTKGKAISVATWNFLPSSTKKRFEPVFTAPRKPRVLENTLHYRWMIADLDIIADQADLADGEVAAWTIIREEQVRALELFRPRLERCDVARRFQFKELETEWLGAALINGRNVDFNWPALYASLRERFPANFNDGWDTSVGENGTADFPVFSAKDAEDFRKDLRPFVEDATREIFPVSA